MRPRSGWNAPRTARHALAAAAGVWSLVALPLAAAVLRVDGTGGSDAGACGSAAAPCATIQRAVDLASGGDTILVAEGVYVDNVACAGGAAVVCVAEPLTVLGGFSGGDWSLPDPSTHVTVIDAQDARRGVIVSQSATDLRLEGFTIRNGRAFGSPGVGGGLRATFTDIVLRDMVFEDNLAQGAADGLAAGGGAAIQADAASVTDVVMERVAFRGNQAVGGGGTGGAAVGGGLVVDFATLQGLALEFEGNTAIGGTSGTAGKDGLGGGAAFAFGTTGTIRQLTAVGNTAAGGTGSSSGGSAFGGALFLEGAESPAANQTQVTILDSSLTGNTATGGDAPSPGGGAGGAAAVFAAAVTVERSEVIGNLSESGTQGGTKASADGGGIFLEWPFASTAPLNVLVNTVVADNSIDGSQGGGGGVRLLGARALVRHATLVDNRILGGGFGSGILVGPRFATPKVSELTMSYSIVADHTTPASSRALYVQAGPTVGSTANLSSPNHFVGNSHHTNAGEAGAGTYVGYPGSNIFDASSSTFFVDPASSNYHVDGTQPPTDAATGSTEALDLDGAARSGTRDMGADEFGAVAFALSVARAGVGDGSVTSSPAGINCGADCLAHFAAGSEVDLHPFPAPGSFFTGWSGDADCVDGTVLMSQDRSCIAQFEDEAPPCTVGEDQLVLTNETVNTTATEQACLSITAGPAYTVGPSGDVTFEAPTIILRDGFAVQGRFVAIGGIP
jgi:hypothetical protein